jgi:hypothetical protein
MKSLSRRCVVRSVASLPLCALPTHIKNDAADAPLFALGLAFDAVSGQIDHAIEHGLHLDWDLLREFDRIEAEILARSATTLEGLFVKAKVACWGLLGDLEPSSQSGTLDRIALSIIRDLVRLHRPELERPGALTKLVEEVGQDAGA